MARQLTLGSLFDGSAGFPLGGILANIKPVWASEVEPFPIRVTSKRLPKMKHLGDVSKIHGNEIEPVDIITFGSPCQDLSVAGRRAGLNEGARSSLFYQAIRIIKEMREATDGRYPRFAVWENVPGAFTSNEGDDFTAVLEAFLSVKREGVSISRPERWSYSGEIMGTDYSVAWRTLDAQYWGVPQRRKRIYAVADFGGQCAGKILFESEGLSRYSAEGFKSWQATTRDTENSIGKTGKYFNLDFNPTDARLKIKKGDISQTLKARMGIGGNNAPMIMEEYISNMCLNDQGGERMSMSQGITATLRAQMSDHAPLVLKENNYMAFASNQGEEAKAIGDKSVALSAEPGMHQQTFIAEKTEDVSAYHLNQRNEMIDLHDKSGALMTANNLQMQTFILEKAKIYGISAYDSNAMKSDNPYSGIRETEVSRTIDCNGGTPACNQGGIAICEKIWDVSNYMMTMGSFPQVCADQSPTLMARDYKDPPIVTQIADEETYAIQGSMIGREDKNGPQGDGVNKNVSFTLNTIDRHGVCKAEKSFGLSKEYGSGENIGEEISPQLIGGGVNRVADKSYVVRRLTPKECARLQGFPDWWCSDLSTENPSEEEMDFWRTVFTQYAEISGCNPKTDKQIRAWLKNPYSDSAEYKMWGNGVALPCVFFVLAGIEYYANLENED